MVIHRFIGALVKLSPHRGFKRMSGFAEFSPPDHVKGMLVLDREQFTKQVTVPCLSLTETDNLNKLIPILKPQLLKLKHLKPVKLSSEGNKIVLLNPAEVKEWTDLPVDKLSLFSVAPASLGSENVEIKYENYQLRDLLKAILPDDLEGVSSFSQSGHIVHVNLRDETLPFKQIIGQVLLDNVSNCRTVVNKLNTIDNVYRNFQLELLAGEHNFQTTVKENGVAFEFDFSKVYWNSRLSTEHDRIVQSVEAQDVVYDVFAGVGPFAVPIARKQKKCRVLANDLNPESVRWLAHNKKLNKIGENLQVFNKDAKEFILKEIKEDLMRELLKEGKRTLRVVMNLPEMGKEFLKYFRGLITDREVLEKWDRERIPILINVYCFVRGEDLIAAAKEAIEFELNAKLTKEMIQGISFVRNVAPNKDMMRVSFYLAKELISTEWEKEKIGEKRKLEEETNENERNENKKLLCLD